MNVLKLCQQQRRLRNKGFALPGGGGVVLQRQIQAPWLLLFPLPKAVWVLVWFNGTRALSSICGFFGLFFFLHFVQFCFFNVCGFLLSRRFQSPHNVLLCLPRSSSWFYAETPWTFGWAGRWVQSQAHGCRRGAVPGRTCLCTTPQPWLTRLLLQALNVFG